jgi:hypothetical protein
MKNAIARQAVKAEGKNRRAVYVAPAIIYEGLISTRAGSGTTPEESTSGSDGADPAAIFGG